MTADIPRVDNGFKNTASRECPLCGGTMFLKEREIVTQIPGNPKPTTRPYREWICPDCDYFEELEEGM